ncbi:hypothetical protein R6Z07M_019735 [Ovis aries]
MLTGEGAFQATNTQLNFLPGAYAQISNAARQAWKKLPSSSTKTEDLSKVRQGPDEPYQDFVARLLDTIGKIMSDEKAGMGDLSDFIRICADIGPSYMQGIAMAAALQGKSIKEDIKSQVIRVALFVVNLAIGLQCAPKNNKSLLTLLIYAHDVKRGSIGPGIAVLKRMFKVILYPRFRETGEGPAPGPETMLWGNTAGSKRTIADLCRATRGSAGLDLCATSYTVLIPEMGVQTLATGVILASAPNKIIVINAGQHIAQLLLVPLVIQGRTINRDRQDKGFGSSDAYWVQNVTEARPELELRINGTTDSPVTHADPIDWKSEEPVWVDQWPLTQEKLFAAQQLVQEQLRLGHIEPSTSAWNSPIFVIKKKSGKWRLLQDLHKCCAGSRRGWYAWRRNSLTYQMHCMTLGEPTSELPTQRQIEALMRYAWNEAHVQPPVTPTNILIMLLLLLQWIQNGAAAAFWAYIPNPPMIQSLGWDREVVPVCVNDTSLLGGKSDIHISPQQANISFYSLTTQYPMCFSYQSQHPYCIQVSADISYPRVTISGIDEKTGKRSYLDGTRPLNIPFCDKHLSIGIGIDTPWTLCRARVASVYNINNADTTLLWDWAPGGTPDFPEYQGQHPPILSVNTAQIYQTELWKLLAAFGHGNRLYLQPNISGSKYGNVGVTGFLYPRACVPYPFMLIQGHVDITLLLNICHLNCSNCILTNCIRGVAKGEQVIIVKQPAFVMLPVEITEAWYDETALELLQRINTALSRTKRSVSLIVLGIVSLITLRATAVTASVSLAQSIQAAHTVDSLSYNVTKVMGTQEDIDKKIRR